MLNRLHTLLSDGGCLLDLYDIQSRADLRKEESAHLPLNLLDGWLRLGYVGQGVWHCLETDPVRKQPIHPSLHLRVCHCHGGEHSDANELFQQSPEPVLDF